MPQTNTPLPYGLRDVKITPYTTGETLGTSIDLPNSRTFTFAESEDFEELRGDDGVVTVRGKGPSVDWDLEAGGVPLEAVRAMFGGTITESGVTPTQVKKYSKKGTDVRGYFKVEGQSISDSGGDFHAVLYKCRATKDLKGTMADGSFWLTGSSGRAIPLSATNTNASALYDFIQNESATAIV